MPNIQFTNNAATTLASSITNVATSLTVATGTGALFPALSVVNTYFYCTLENTAGTSREIVKVTARSGDVLTIVRGQEGTTGTAFSSGDKVELRVTAQGLNDVMTFGTGGTDVSSATTVTLTNASTQIQNVTMTAAGQYVVLPDATTLTKGNAIFIIDNRGFYPFGVKDSAGNILVANVGSQSQNIFTLIDSSTAAGKWASGTQNLQTSVGNTNVSTITNYSSNTIKVCALSTSLIVISYISADTLSIIAVAATVSGTTITFGTPVTMVTTTTASDLGSLIAYSATQFVVSYSNTTNQTEYIQAGTVSGTTITAGTASSAVQVSSNSIGSKTAMISSTVGVWFYANNSDTLVALKAYTLSGTTFTFGTAVGVTTVSFAYPNSIFQTTSGVCMFNTSSTGAGYIGFVTNSGTTLTVGSTYSKATYPDTPIGFVGTNTVGGSSGTYLLSGNTISSYSTVNGALSSKIATFTTGISIGNAGIIYAGNGYIVGYSKIAINITNNTQDVCTSDSSTAIVVGTSIYINATVVKLLWS